MLSKWFLCFAVGTSSAVASAQPLIDPLRLAGEELRGSAVREAERIGLFQCSEFVGDAVLFLSGGGEAVFRIEPGGLDRRRSGVVIYLEANRNNLPTSLSFIYLMPDCSGFYLQHMSWDYPCSKIRKKFPDYAHERTLSRYIFSMRKGDNLEIFFNNVKSGCSVIKKELFRAQNVKKRKR